MDPHRSGCCLGHLAIWPSGHGSIHHLYPREIPRIMGIVMQKRTVQQFLTTRNFSVPGYIPVHVCIQPIAGFQKSSRYIYIYNTHNKSPFFLLKSICLSAKSPSSFGALHWVLQRRLYRKLWRANAVAPNTWRWPVTPLADDHLELTLLLHQPEFRKRLIFIGITLNGILIVIILTDFPQLFSHVDSLAFGI